MLYGLPVVSMHFHSCVHAVYYCLVFCADTHKLLVKCTHTIYLQLGELFYGCYVLLIWLYAFNVTCYVVTCMAVLSVYIHTVHSHCQAFCLHLHILRNACSILHIILYIHFHVSTAIDLMFSPNVRTTTATE